MFLEAHRQNPANFSEAGQSAATGRLGELTPALVLQLLAPLLVFFLGYASVSGERESGTFALALAQGISPRVIVTGKALALVLLGAAILLPGVTVAVLLTGAASPESLGRFALLVGAYGSYIAVCALLTAGVSVAQRTSRASLTALLLIWVAGWIAMPRALQAWARRARHCRPALASTQPSKRISSTKVTAMTRAIRISPDSAPGFSPNTVSPRWRTFPSTTRPS